MTFLMDSVEKLVMVEVVIALDRVFSLRRTR